MKKSKMKLSSGANQLKPESENDALHGVVRKRKVKEVPALKKIAPTGTAKQDGQTVVVATTDGRNKWKKSIVFWKQRDL